MKCLYPNINNSFAVSPEFKEDYTYKIQIGFEHLKESTIGIVGLCRNVGKKIDSLKIFIQTLNQFTNIKTFLYENDSLDNTKELLSNMKKEINNFNYVSKTLKAKQFGQTKERERTTKLAKYRNECLKYAKTNFKDTDYILVIDTDFIEISLEGLLHSFGCIKTNDKISAMCGISYQYKYLFNKNSRTPWNYDSWAFRGTWWEDQHKYTKGFDNMLWFGFWCPPLGSSPIPINSGFGASCIYKTQQYVNCEYEGYDCEHVCFHKNLKNTYPDFQLFINPSQIILLDIL